VCYSKAIANGYPLAVGLGREELRRAAGSIFFAGAFWTAAVPVAAAIGGGVAMAVVLGEETEAPVSCESLQVSGAASVAKEGEEQHRFWRPLGGLESICDSDSGVDCRRSSVRSRWCESW
jgi:hypothetical protein